MPSKERCISTEKALAFIRESSNSPPQPRPPTDWGWQFNGSLVFGSWCGWILYALTACYYQCFRSQSVFSPPSVHLLWWRVLNHQNADSSSLTATAWHLGFSPKLRLAHICGCSLSEYNFCQRQKTQFEHSSYLGLSFKTISGLPLKILHAFESQGCSLLIFQEKAYDRVSPSFYHLHLLSLVFVLVMLNSSSSHTIILFLLKPPRFLKHAIDWHAGMMSELILVAE